MQKHENISPIFFTFINGELIEDINGHQYSFMDMKLLLDQSRHFGADHYFVYDIRKCKILRMQALSQILGQHHTLDSMVFGDVIFNQEQWIREHQIEHKNGACTVRSRSTETIGVNWENFYEGLTIEDIFELQQKFEIRAQIKSVKEREYKPILGHILSHELLARNGLLYAKDVDPLGEHGDFHTQVIGYENIKFKTLKGEKSNHTNCLLFKTHRNLNNYLENGESSELEFSQTGVIIKISRSNINETLQDFDTEERTS